MPIETTKWDTTRYLKSKEDIAAYLEAVFELGDAGVIAHALGEVARAEGMTQIAKETGLSRESLYRTLSAVGNPELATVLKVMKALGLAVSVKPADDAQRGFAAAS